MIDSRALAQPPALELNAERVRLAEAPENKTPWYRWGPYLSARQWGTVRIETLQKFHHYYGDDFLKDEGQKTNQVGIHP